MDHTDANDEFLEAAIVRTDDPAAAMTGTQPNILPKVLRRWRIILVTFLVFSIVGVPAVWLLVQPKFQATAAIQIDTVVYSILFTDQQSDSVLPMYENFKNTQARLILSETVLQRVADDLIDKDLALFRQRNQDFTAALHEAWETKNFAMLLQKDMGPVDSLRKAIGDGDLAVASDRRSELLLVSMVSPSGQEAEVIVNSLVRAYMAVEVSKQERGGDEKLTLLDTERRRLATEVEQQQESIFRMTEEYGMADLARRHDMMLAYMEELHSQLTKMQADRAELERQIKLLSETEGELPSVDSESQRVMLERRNVFVNTDERIKKLTDTIIDAEQQLILAQQTLSAENPDLKQRSEFIDTLNERLEQRRAELEKEFDEVTRAEEESMGAEFTRNRERELDRARKALEHAVKYEELLQERIQTANSEAIVLGRKHQVIKKQQEQLALNKGLYDTIRQRIKQLEMEQKRPARISLAYQATSRELPNKRMKLTAALMFGALACGAFLGFLRVKADRSLHTPEDIVRVANVPVIGTTVGLNRLDSQALPERLTQDYQTIRANLKLLADGEIPRKLVITSPGPREGKSTFAVNLAASLARTGKKVLLIDGDFHKPDIGHMLDLANGTPGLGAVLRGEVEWKTAVCTIPLTGVDVLPNNSRDSVDPVELLSRSEIIERLNAIADRYDHMIVDTPPVLVAADSLLWAKLSDAVVLISFAGQTAGPALKEAIEKLAQVKVRILGNVLSNVQSRSSYSYHDYAYAAAARKKAGKDKNLFLLPQDDIESADT